MYLEKVSCGMCGHDMRISTDPDIAWRAQDDLVCGPCAAQATLQRTEQHKHKDEDPTSKLPHYSEGRIFVAAPAPVADDPATQEVTG